jgi:ketosteroid isomerase-like protein
MHANAALLDKLFTALVRRDPEAMAACYRADARFRDIAFDLESSKEIADMWRMICGDEVDMKVLEREIVEADDRSGRVRIVESYAFGASKDPPRKGVRITNAIVSRFEFEDGRIRGQVDSCDEKLWAGQALGRGIKGFLAGRFRPLRSAVANRKLAKFVRTHRGRD